MWYDYTLVAATANWLQNALSDMGHSVCGLSPSLGNILLHRINPITLLAAGCSVSLIISKCLIELEYVTDAVLLSILPYLISLCSDVHLADVTAALFNSALMCGTMLPLSIYSGKILLQVPLRSNPLAFSLLLLECS